MGMIGTFDGFTTARLGIYAAQHGFRVTGNNISNINTVGYTRQRLEQESMKVGGADMYRSMYDNHVGNGAIVTSINQIRDPYLDITYRNTRSDVGFNDSWLAGLNEIARTLDEVDKGMETNKTEEGDGVLYAQLNDLRDMLMQLMNDPNKDNDTLVRNSASTLCELFHSYSRALEQLRKDLDDSFSKDLDTVNTTLTNIRNLNESIRNAEIVGDNALELRDERNRQIDSLSEYMHIKVEYVMEDIGGGKQVEKLNIYLANANPDPLVKTDETQLISGIYGAKLLYPEKLKVDDPDNPGQKKEIDNTNYTLVVGNMVDSKNRLPKEEEHNKINAGHPVTLADNDIHGALQAMRELLTEKGEFCTENDIAIDPEAASKRGLPYYQLSLDLLARQFAETYNALNQGPMVDENDNVIYEQITGTVGDLGLRVLTPDELAKSDRKGLAGVGGYYVDKNGCYVGPTDAAHQPECLLTRAGISVNDSLEAALAKLREADTDANQLWAPRVDGVLNQKGEIIPGQEDAAKQILQDLLADHGVPAPDPVDPTVQISVIATKSVEGSGPLFSIRNDLDDTVDADGNGFTAANISISHSWSIGDVKVVPRFKELFNGDVTDSTQNTNIDHMITKIDESLLYDPRDLVPDAVSGKLFEGNFNGMFINMGAVLAEKQRTTGINVNMYYYQMTDIDTSRDGVSGVDLNDEAMNIMQFQKAYTAACRMMTAIDEALDRLISNTGIAGR